MKEIKFAQFLRKFTIILIAICLGLSLSLAQQSKITIEEREMGTYMFSDPDPVANIGYIYPYFRFDGYTNKKEMKTWKMVIMENDYIKVFITPEIGGKIWGAIEKSTGREFIYFNDVVKFRDVAMRGAWTSGGIESNFGIIGHTPTVSTPIDYVTRENSDGSVSCFIGATDLTSGTVWRMEINLPADQALFKTKATWYNPTKFSQSYYHWMNAAVRTEGNLEYAYPGAKYIGHDGSVHEWPLMEDGRDISWYENNNFGGYKSYHVLGELTNFYGGYYHDDNFGFGHYSDYDDKPGKKLWIWGLSDQGMIWEDLLTDSDGQYTEVQSGRLFNQEAASSVLTPFKHRGFSPGTWDSWEELWFPIKDTKGAIQAIPEGVINLEKEDNSLEVYFYANTTINSNLVLEFNGEEILNEVLALNPTQTTSYSISFEGDAQKISARLGDTYLIPPGGLEAQTIARPLRTTGILNWESAYGNYLMGRQKEEERKYQEAEKYYFKSLNRDGGYISTLEALASMKLRKMQYDSAKTFINWALSIDTYSPKANFLYGVLNEENGNITDAIEGYSIASHSVEYRVASFTALARVYLKRGEVSRSLAYCEKALRQNNIYIPAMEYQIIGLRKSGKEKEALNSIDKLLELDPLNHLARFEKYLMSKMDKDLASFGQIIRNEFPTEVFLELGSKYFKVGATSEAIQVLRLSPNSPIINYWIAYLGNADNATGDAIKIVEGNRMSPFLVFPYRRESRAVLEWTARVNSNWKPKYYLGLLEWSLGNINEAMQIFSELENEPDYYPFYMSRAELFRNNSEIQEKDLKTAVEFGPNDWRTGYALTNYYLENDMPKEAQKISSDFFRRFPENYYLGLQNAKLLLQQGEYEKCLAILQNLDVLPNEGATEGRKLYNQVNLNLAKQSLIEGQFEEALTYARNGRQWPKNLGVGRPYEVDEILEFYLEARAQQLSGNANEAKALFEKVMSSESASADLKRLLQLAVYKNQGNLEAGKSHVSKWLSMEQSTLANWGLEWLNDERSEELPSNEPLVLWVVDLLIKDNN